MGVGFLLLLKNLAGLRRKKSRRFRRVVFCLITATALALTYFTPLSKFHLLWVLPLQFIVGMIGFGLLAGAGLAHHKITARKPEREKLSADLYPPFGELKWSEYEWWEGEARLSAWAGFQARGGPYNSQDSDLPSDGSVTVVVNPNDDATQLEPTQEQCRAMELQIHRGEEVVQAVLVALLPYYQNLKKEWEANDEDMPPVSEIADFRGMIGLGQVHVLAFASDGLAYVGLEFGCDWDDEHGLGIVLHGKDVVEIGQGSDAFDWQPQASTQS